MTEFEQQGLQSYRPERDGQSGNGDRTTNFSTDNYFEYLTWRGEPDPGGRVITVPGTQKLPPPTQSPRTTLKDFLNRNRKT